MSTTAKRRSPVYRQLEAYEESWKKDHDEAMACWEWEDAIAVGINIFHMLCEREDVWRDQVFRGVMVHTEDDDLDHRTRFSNWLATTNEVLADVLPSLETRFGLVKGAPELRERAQAADQILRAWRAPRLSQAVGLRDMTLTPEAAAQLDCILAEAKKKPPQMPKGPMPKEISADEFFANLKSSKS